MTIVDYAIGGNIQMLRRMANESNVNTVGTYSRGVLHWAVIRGNIEMLKLWLSLPNCNINIQSSSGNTPLHECVVWKYYITSPFRDIPNVLEMISILLKAGADITIGNNYGQTPLSMLTDKDCKIRRHIRNFIYEPYHCIETFFCCAQYIIDEMEIDETMEIEGYEYEDDEIYFFSELVKRIKEEAILYDIFKFL
jgi:hypothetical protein